VNKAGKVNRNQIQPSSSSLILQATTSTLPLARHPHPRWPRLGARGVFGVVRV